MNEALEHKKPANLGIQAWLPRGQIISNYGFMCHQSTNGDLIIPTGFGNEAQGF